MISIFLKGKNEVSYCGFDTEFEGTIVKKVIKKGKINKKLLKKYLIRCYPARVDYVVKKDVRKT